MENTKNENQNKPLGWSIFGLILIWPWLNTRLFDNPSAIRYEIPYICAGIFLLIVAFLPGKIFRTPTGGGMTRAIHFLCYFLVLNIVSWYFADDELSAGFGIIRAYLFAAVVAALLLICGRLKDSRIIQQALSISGAIVGLVLMCIMFVQSVWPSVELIKSPFGMLRQVFPFTMPASLGAFGMIGTLSSICLALTTENPDDPKQRSGKYIILAILSALGLIFSGTMSCFVGTIAGIWAIALAKARKKATFLKVSAVFISCAIIFPYHYLQLPEGRQRMFTSSWGLRPLSAKIALLMAADRPAVGWGPGTFTHGACLKEDRNAYLHSGRGGYYLSAHCEPAQVLGENGLIGFTLWMTFIILLIQPLFGEGHIDDGESYIKLRNRIPAVLVLAMTVDSCFSPSYRQNDIYALYAVVCALAIYALGRKWGRDTGRYTPAREYYFRGWQSWMMRIGLALFGVVVIYKSCESLYGQRHLAKSFQALTESRLDTANSEAEIASHYAPSIHIWQQSMGIRSYAMRETKNWEECIAINNTVLDSFPTFALFVRSNLQYYQQSNMLDKEFETIARFLVLQPYSIEFRRHMHNFLSKMTHDEFLAMKLRFQKRDFNVLLEGDWYFLEAVCLRENKQTGKAYQKMGTLNAQYISVMPFFTEYGRMLVEDGELEEALNELEIEISEIPADVVALYYAAMAHKEKESYEEAFILLDRAVRERIEYAPAVVMYGEFLMATGDMQGAEEVLHKCIDVDHGRLLQTIGDRVSLYATLIRCLVYQGREAEAHQQYDIAVSALNNSEAAKLLREKLPGF